MVVGRVAMGLVVGVVAAPLACGGRSLSDEGGGDANGGTRSGGAGSGGTTSSGGSVSTGGVSTGGVSTGGVSTGGVSTGGVSTGGVSTGGVSTGGVSTGGCDDLGRAIDDGRGVTLVPSCDGWFDRTANPLGMQGSWYAFGDQYPGLNDAKCTEFGMHPPEQCSFVATPPPPPSLGFPQRVAGEMCTSGETAIVSACAPGLMTSGCPERDYANITGAGIAFDFNADRGEDGGARHPWNSAAFGIIGFSFEIDEVPSLALRVEISQLLTDAEADAVGLSHGSTTDDHPDGSPYWGASMTYPASPAMPGVNRVLWTDIRPPRTNYVFDTQRILGLAFHVTADPLARKTYGFCIKNLTMLRE